MIQNHELKKYDNETTKKRFDFLLLGNYFLNMVDDAVVNGNLTGLDYVSFHLFNDDETKDVYIQFVSFISDFCGNLKRKDYPLLVDNLCSLIIVLLEHEAKKENPIYIQELNSIWCDIVKNDEVLKNNSHFSKYLI